jgi:iron complex outermembrane receptor protein
MNTPRNRIVGMALAFACLSLGALRLLAQPAVTPAASASTEDETLKLASFVVTGSAIPTPANETFSPVTVFSPSDMARWGAAMPIEAVRHLPGFTGAVATEQRSNGGSGSAGVNLRGLAGTLTLLDGQRTSPFTNFNLMPVIALQSVEVVKDGASSVYGADALAGVFNNILVKRFNGVKVDFYYGNTTQNDAGVVRGGLLAGYTRGDTDAVVGVEILRRNALHSSDRDPSNVADQRFRGGINGGSPTYSGRATARVGGAANPVQDLVLAPGKTVGLTAADFVVFDPNNVTSNQFFNFRQYTPSIPRQEREMAFARVNHRLFGGKVEAHARLLWSHDEFFNGLAPSPMPTGGPAGIALRNAIRQSPHIPTGFFIQDNGTSAASAITNGSVPFRTVALGPRAQLSRRDAWDFNTGFNGRFGEDWQWSLNYVYSVLYSDVDQSGAPGRTALVAKIVSGEYNPWALDTVAGTGPTGLAFDNPKALAASAAQGRTDGEFPQRGFNVNFSGSLFPLPAGEVKIGFGGDYYRVDSSSIPEPIFFSGDLLGLNASNPSISRAYGNGAFAELQFPLVKEEMNIPLVRTAKLSLAGRYDYQTVEGYTNGVLLPQVSRSFTAHNPKVGFTLQPHEDLLLRATWGTGFRLPSLGQLFAAAGASNPQLRDPLGFPIANQTGITTQGNPALNPEESKTYSFGFVWSPKSIDGLSVIADYYFGEIKGLVGEGSQFILNVNAAGQGSGFVAGNPATINPNAPFASRITRAANGSVTTVASTNFNISARKTTGVDFAVSYVWPWRDAGKFTTRFDWNTALTWDLTPVPGQPAQSFLGVYLDVSNNAISPGSIPKHKGYLSQLWQKGDWAAVVTANYISELRDDPNFSFVAGTVREIEAWVTCDAQVEYKFAQGGDGWRRHLDGLTLRVGAANVLDEKAPFSAGAFNDGYDVTTHSNRGRFVYAQLTKKY